MQAAMAVGISVTTRSQRPLLRATSMAGALSWAGRIFASGIWGRHTSYQTVLIWLVQTAPARSCTPWAEAKALSEGVRATMEA